MNGEIKIKTIDEIEKMREGGIILSKVLKELAENVKVGVTTLELDSLAHQLLLKTGGEPSFMRVPGYKFSTCMTVNDEVVHGLPTKYKLIDGDLLGIDIGLLYKGFHTDTSTSVVAGQTTPEMGTFLEAGRRSLKRAVDEAKVGKTVWDISHAMEEVIRGAGFSPVKSLTGHGIGRDLHESPSIPCFAVGERTRSVKLVDGMVLAIETIYNQGSADVVYKNDDGWTISTADGKLSGLYEVTVAVTRKGPEVLTPLVSKV